MSTLEVFRRQKDDYYKYSADSPIPPSKRAEFAGLNYYPENPALRLSVHPEEFATKEPVTMMTSTGETQEYLRWGRFQVEVNGATAALTVYQAPWGGYFLPFIDATSGTETYGAGRYLEPEEGEDGSLIVDFNLAYHPYCVFSDEYSCPIPPDENRIALPIRAGERL